MLNTPIASSTAALNDLNQALNSASLTVLRPLPSSLDVPNLVSSQRSANLVFIDAALPDVQTLLAGVSPTDEVYLLNPNGNEMAQITSVLAGRSGIQSLQIFSHGSDGALQLGNTSLNTANLIDYAGVLQSWAGSLSADADILLYGCNLATDGIGQSFVSQIAALTGADVAASTDLTGSMALGGNWNLEFSTGSIEASNFLSDWAQTAYQNVLATYDVTTIADSGAGSLRQAILNANGTAGLDTINILVGNTITLTTGELVISDDTTINGNGVIVSGNNSSRVFFVNSGTVSLQNLTVANGRAQGGSGGSSGAGGGGAAGMGGGLFINAGSVSLNTVNFSNNQAVGGAGGAGGRDFYGGGGGGIGGNGGDGSELNRLGGTGGNGGALGGIPGAGGTVSNNGTAGDSGAGGGGGGFGGSGIGNFGGSGGFGGGGGGGGYGNGDFGGSGGAGGFGGGGGGGAGPFDGRSGGLGGSFGGSGGSSGSYGGGGGGGAGLGGAIFLRSGTLNLTTVSFTSNSATGGAGGSGARGSAETDTDAAPGSNG
jgi:hypothetical protein